MTQTTGGKDTSGGEGRPSASRIRAEAEPAWPSPRRGWIRFVALLVVAAAALSIPYYLHSLLYESTDDAFIDGDIVPISSRVEGHVARVCVTDNQFVKAGDLLVELDPRDFRARLDAAVAALASAKASDKARQAEAALIRITASAGLDEARAGVEAARAEVKSALEQARAAASRCDQAKAKVDLSRAAVGQAEADADAARAVCMRDRLDLKRFRQMAKAGAVSRQDMDHATAASQVSEADLEAAQKKIETQKSMLRQAQAEFRAAKDDLRRAGAQIAVFRARLDQARARLASAQSAPERIRRSQSLAAASSAGIGRAEAEVTQARLNLSYTKIYAPVSGFVTKKAVEPGQSVETAQSLMAIVPKGVWVRANFKETQLTRMHPGQPVKITVDAYPDRTFHGHVDSIQHGSGARFSLLPPENATGNFVKVVQRVPVKIVFDRPKEISGVLLAPGMSVVPEVYVGARGEAPGP